MVCPVCEKFVEDNKVVAIIQFVSFVFHRSCLERNWYDLEKILKIKGMLPTRKST